MEHFLDVSDLEPCEPLDRTLEGIAKLGPGDYLRVIHRREPHLLYPLLQQQGFAWQTCPTGPGRYEIFIWRDGDNDAKTAALEKTPDKRPSC